MKTRCTQRYETRHIDEVMENLIEREGILPNIEEPKINSTPPRSAKTHMLGNSPQVMTPKTPMMPSSESMMDISPFPSNTDDFVLYSDSDGASQSSFDKSPRRGPRHDDEEHRGLTPSHIHTPKSKHTKTASILNPVTHLNNSSLSPSPSPSPNKTSLKPKKRVRRRSSKSADGLASEKSHRSSVRHNGSEYYMGTGYTLMPATGKIFRNLLILEESLREQVIQQRALRRKYLTFLSILCSLIASISHHLFFVDPILSSTGTVRVVLQFCLLALLVTLMLYHLSGEYQKTIVVPRKFLSSTNKGLRQLNVRLIKIKTPLSDTIIDLIREFLLFIATMCINSLHTVYPSTVNNKNSRLEVFLVSCQLQCQPRIGVTDVKLILNARVFNTDIREGWELYRSEFWIHEGVRRRNNMMLFKIDDKNVLDRDKLLKKDKKERRERRKSTVSNEPVMDLSPQISNRLSEQNLEKLARGFDYKGDVTYYEEE